MNVKNRLQKNKEKGQSKEATGPCTDMNFQVDWG